ncbi:MULTISPECIES: signal peptidase II [Massilia]|uniref:Lipoprotein signal peptidase n=1 Tax=Massilia haematophila TaxID=457923 RepID=A0ABV7PGV6_9BURK|nr:signal peptidase II [Massilia arenae]
MTKPLKPLAAVVFAGLIATVDLATKAAIVERLAYGQQIELLPSLNIVHVINQGAAFGLLATAGGWQRYLFIVVAVLASILIVRMIRKPETGSAERIGLAMILGGAVGNLVDRTARMGVVDWIDVYVGVHHWPAFNIADIGITLGAAIIVLHALFGVRAAAPAADKTR